MFKEWRKKRKAKKRAKKNLYAGVDFSGSPTASPVDMFGKSVSTPGVAASLSRRRRDKLVGGG